MIKKDYKNTFLFYALKFLGLFFIIYFVTESVIALSVPRGYYSGIIHDYFDYVSWLRTSLLYGAKRVLSAFGLDTYIAGKYSLRLKDGFGVRVVYSCLGYGVMSFWIAFISANKGNLRRKLLWILGGLFLIWLINVIRICLLLVATNKYWHLPLHLDHHTLFNILSYLAIFILIYFYDKSGNVKLEARKLPTSDTPITDQ